MMKFCDACVLWGFLFYIKIQMDVSQMEKSKLKETENEEIAAYMIDA